MRAVLRGILLLACGCSGLEFSLILDQDAPGHKQNEAAVHALQKGDAEKALQTLHKAVKRHSNAALQNSVGVALMYLAKSRQTFSKDKLQEAALHAFNQTVLLAGGSLGGKGGKGRKMQAAKGSDLEVALANQQLASRYLEASRLNRLGIQLDLQNRWEEAAVVLREAQKAAPGYDPLITSNLGTVIYKNATHRSSGWAEAGGASLRARPGTGGASPPRPARQSGGDEELEGGAAVTILPGRLAGECRSARVASSKRTAASCGCAWDSGVHLVGRRQQVLEDGGLLGRP